MNPPPGCTCRQPRPQAEERGTWCTRCGCWMLPASPPAPVATEQDLQDVGLRRGAAGHWYLLLDEPTRMWGVAVYAVEVGVITLDVVHRRLTDMRETWAELAAAISTQAT